MFDFSEHRKRCVNLLTQRTKNNKNSLDPAKDYPADFLKNYIAPYFFDAIEEEPFTAKHTLTLEPTSTNSYYWHVYFENGMVDEIIRIPKKYTTNIILKKASELWKKDSENTFAYITWSIPEESRGDILKIEFFVELFY